MQQMDAHLYRGPIIDAHHHVWDLSLGQHPWLRPQAKVAHRYGSYDAIKHDYLPKDLARDAAGQNVVATVYMEAEWNPAEPLAETAWVAHQSALTGVPGAMAAQAWLDAPDVAQVLQAQAACPLVRSIRHKPGGAASVEQVRAGVRSLMSDRRWQSGYALLARHGLHFELQTPWWNLAEAAALASRHPETIIVINHAGVLLDHRRETLEGWHAAMAEAAAWKNIVVKASGLCIEGAGWVHAVNRQVLHDLVHLFGPERVMFGSNFPVDGMFIGYAALLDAYRDILAVLSPHEQRAIFHDTAARIYAPLPRQEPSTAARG